jgi:type II secretory pathway pseudopilin PulG
VTIIENLIAITLLGLVLTASSRMIISTIQANRSARGFAGAIAEVQKSIDGYRTGSYTAILDKFGGTYSSIEDNETVTETTYSDASRTTLVTTYTAIKTSSTAFPEAVRITIDATQRRAALGDAQYRFETVIAHIR